MSYILFRFQRIALEHGVKFTAHHSLSQPPLSYADLQNRLFGDVGSQQIESSSTQDSANCDAMEVCTATSDGDSKKLIVSPPVFNAFQKSIVRWNRTISFVAKVFFLSKINLKKFSFRISMTISLNGLVVILLILFLFIKLEVFLIFL